MNITTSPRRAELLSNMVAWLQSRKASVQIVIEWAIILLFAYYYAGPGLLNLSSTFILQEAGEHNESSTFPILAEIGLNRYGEIPLWNPYSLTGLPHVEDPLNHFWHPVSTIPVMLWGGINGMKVSVFIAFILAGLGQWLFAHVFGVRGFLRLWTALLFMLSGGLAFLWHYGWYELLLGVVWFPWCFAAVWWALRRRDFTSMILAAVCVVMVLTTGGGYYPFYLLVSLGILTVLNLFWSGRAKRWARLSRAIWIVSASLRLLAVVILPIVSGYFLINRWTGDDPSQTFSQPIPYALVNYIVYDRAWEGAAVLDVPSGWKWFYIGVVAFGGALCLAPLSLALHRWRRLPLITAGVLTLAFLAWMANRYTPVQYIYDLIPFLYKLRFPNRLLVVATSPLLVLAGLGWQSLWRQVKPWSLNHDTKWVLTAKWKDRAFKISILKWVLNLSLILIMTASIIDVYNVNMSFAFSAENVDKTLENTLIWLKEYDKGMYYIQMGPVQAYAKGMSVAYRHEMLVLNFDYGRRLFSIDRQSQPESPFVATPKYVIAVGPPLTLPANAQKLNNPDGYELWYLPDALPAAFSAPPAQLQAGAKLSKEMAAPVDVKYDGPNRVVASGEPARPNDQLVVLVSNYPGWELQVDGKPAPLVPANEYLGAAMLPGTHTYTFTFRPLSFYLGLIISAITLLLMLGLLLKESPLWPKLAQLRWRSRSAASVEKAL